MRQKKKKKKKKKGLRRRCDSKKNSLRRDKYGGGKKDLTGQKFFFVADGGVIYSSHLLVHSSLGTVAFGGYIHLGGYCSTCQDAHNVCAMARTQRDDDT